MVQSGAAEAGAKPPEAEVWGFSSNHVCSLFLLLECNYLEESVNCLKQLRCHDDIQLVAKRETAEWTAPCSRQPGTKKGLIAVNQRFNSPAPTV
jgi:hypothetical protein